METGSGRWTNQELIRLHNAFRAQVGQSWDEAVQIAAASNSVVPLGVKTSVWQAISVSVQTRSAQQCASKLNADRVTMGRFGSIPTPSDRELTLPLVDTSAPPVEVEGPANRAFVTAAIKRVVAVARLDISPYRGTPSGRVVRSADRATLILRADAFLVVNDTNEG